MSRSSMGPFEDRIRAVTGVGGNEPSTNHLEGPVHSVETVAEIQRLETTVAGLVRAVVSLQTAAIESAAEIDRINDASR
jgi:hypothetical protein